MFRATQALAVSQECAPNISRKYKGRSYRRILCLKFHFFFRAIFLNFRIFHYSAPTIGMRSVPNILPSVKFPNFGNVSCFSCFCCFSWEKREEKLEKKMFDKGRSYRRTLCLKFQIFFLRIFLYFHIFQFFFPTIRMRRLPNILPSVKFPNFGNAKLWKC